MQPTVEANKTTITLYVKDEIDVTTLTEVPVTITVSEKATALLASDNKVDLSEGTAKIVVQAENGTKVTYTINVSKALTYFDFEEWKTSPYATPTQGKWASSNNGLNSATSYVKEHGYPITQSEDTPTGKGLSARIETVNTKGYSVNAIIFKVDLPHVTAGSLFTGTFSASFSALNNPLTATKFGDDFAKKPLVLKAEYKYKPGEDFYRSEDPKGVVAVLEKGTVDKCAINAILYDITENADYITGVKTYEDPRIVAKAMFSTDKTSTSFEKIEIPFEYGDGKTYDAERKYRLAILTSSSAAGDTFSGAPGSVLYIDNIEIISE